MKSGASLVILATLIAVCASAVVPLYLVPQGEKDAGAENRRVVRGLLDLASAKERYPQETFELNKQYELRGGPFGGDPGYGPFYNGYDPFYNGYGPYYDGYGPYFNGYPNLDRTMLSQKDTFTAQRGDVFSVLGITT